MNKLEAIEAILQMGGDVEVEPRGAADGKVTQVVLSNQRFRDEHLALLEPLAPFEFLGVGGLSQITEAGIRSLARFTWLTKLSLGGAKAEDVSLSHLSNLKRLRYLSLDRTQVTDNGLAALRDYRELSWLNLGRMRITSRGLEHLRQLPLLKVLDLFATQVGDEGAAILGEMKQLEKLYLRRTGVTDKALAALARLPKLEILALDGNAISASGVRALLATPTLKILCLEKTNVDDSVVPILASMPNLTEATLTETKVTREAALRLQSIRRDLEVQHEAFHPPGEWKWVVPAR